MEVDGESADAADIHVGVSDWEDTRSEAAFDMLAIGPPALATKD
jgi:hypothetical protein